jgi:hypothetical protein
MTIELDLDHAIRSSVRRSHEFAALVLLIVVLARSTSLLSFLPPSETGFLTQR